MVSQSLGDSEKFSTLTSDTNRLAYVLLITYADSEGRFLADSVTLRGKLYTRLPWTPDQVERALIEMHDVDLIQLYTAGKHRYGVITGFHEHNTIRRNADGTPKEEAASRIPAPPERAQTNSGTGEVPEPYRSKPGVTQAEVEVEVEVEREIEVERKDQKRTSLAATRATDHTPYLNAWNERRGNLPAVRALDAKRKRAIDNLIKEHGDQALTLFTAAVDCVASDDFWIERGYNLDNLLRPGRVLEKAEKHAASFGMRPNDRKLATRAQQIARAIGGLDA